MELRNVEHSKCFKLPFTQNPFVYLTSKMKFPIKLFIIYVFISIIPNVSDFFCSAARAALYCLPCLRSSWARSRLQVWAWECRLTVTELCRVLANRRGY